MHLIERYLITAYIDRVGHISVVQSIALSPTDPKVIVVEIEFGAVIRSGDGGANWSGHLDGSLRDCHTMVFHKTDRDWVYESGGRGGGAAVSKDGGKNWQKQKQNLDRSYGWPGGRWRRSANMVYIGFTPA